VAPKESPGAYAILTEGGAKVTAVGCAEEALAALQGGVTPADALTGFTGLEHRESVVRVGFQLYVESPSVSRR
jgi:hypothetical protein